ncbi:hypothetical protein V8P77_16630 [Rhizobium sp. 1AS14I]
MGDDDLPHPVHGQDHSLCLPAVAAAVKAERNFMADLPEDTEFLLQPAARALGATICQQRKLKAFRDWLLTEISHS